MDFFKKSISQNDLNAVNTGNKFYNPTLKHRLSNSFDINTIIFPEI